MPVFTFRGHSGPVTSVATSFSGRHIYTASVDATIRSWNIPSLKRDAYEPYQSLHFKSYIGHTDIVWDVLAHPVESVIVSCSADSTIKIWDAETADLRHTMKSPDATQMCWSTDYKFMCIGSVSGAVQLLNLETQSLIHEIKSHSRITDLCVNHDTGILAVAGEDKSISLYDSRSSSGKEVIRLDGHPDVVSSLAFGAENSLLSSGMFGVEIVLYVI